MKKNKSLLQIRLEILSVLRKRRRSLVKKRRRNIIRNKGTGLKKDRISWNPYTNKIDNITIDAGKVFTLFDKPENLINIINRLDKYRSNKQKSKNIEIDLAKIEEIDIGAISVFLAKINELSKIQKLKIWGTTPTNPDCKKVFYESGFLDYMVDLAGKKFSHQGENFIVNVGSEKTRNERVGKTIEKTILHLTGKEDIYPPVYSIVQEICSNSVEWANPSESENINWFLGVSYDSDTVNPSATFIMTDVGFGIISTLNRRFGKIIESFKFTKDTEVLQRAFDRKYGSKSGEANRNKGLPLIQDRFNKNYIKDLKVITNNVLLDFENPELNKVLDCNLPGTFYCWKIDLKCIESWKEAS